MICALCRSPKSFLHNERQSLQVVRGSTDVWLGQIMEGSCVVGRGGLNQRQGRVQPLWGCQHQDQSLAGISDVRKLRRRERLQDGTHEIDAGRSNERFDGRSVFQRRLDAT